jgi:hypothetical protein
MEQMVEEACRAASFQTFARDRWEGFLSAAGGVALSGGQKLQLTIGPPSPADLVPSSQFIEAHRPIA